MSLLILLAFADFLGRSFTVSFLFYGCYVVCYTVTLFLNFFLFYLKNCTRSATRITFYLEAIRRISGNRIN